MLFLGVMGWCEYVLICKCAPIMESPVFSSIEPELDEKHKYDFYVLGKKSC